MKLKSKIILSVVVIVFTLLFLVLGQYIGGLVYFKLTNIPLNFITFDALYDGFIHYRYDEQIKKMVFGGVFISIFIGLIPIFFTIVFFIANTKKEQIYGSARFATKSEIKRSGLLDKDGDNGLIIGMLENSKEYLTLYGQLFLGISARTRSGKGVSVVITNLLNYLDSMVVVDIKFENFIATAGYRKSIGQEIFLFAPMGYFENPDDIENEKIRTHRWNCFDYVRRSNSFRVSDLLVIAGSLYPTSNEKSDIWNNLAAKLFNGLCLWMLDTEEITNKKASLPYLYSLTSVEGGLVDWMKSEITKGYCSVECVHEFHNFINMANDTRASVLSNLVSPLAILGDQVVAYSLSESDFDFRDLRKKRMTIYLGIPPPKLEVLSKLLNLFFEQLINENTTVLPEQDPQLKYQCCLMLDEFSALGRIKQIESAIAFAAGYNLRFVFIYQDRAQLENKHLYGQQGATIIESSQGCKIIFPPKEVNETVKNLSITLGTKTVKSFSRSRSYGKNSSKSVSPVEKSRPLMMPHEIVELGNLLVDGTQIGSKTIILKENLQPFISDKVVYFTIPKFIERKKFSEKNIPIIPLLDMNKEI